MLKKDEVSKYTVHKDQVNMLEWPPYSQKNTAKDNPNLNKKRFISQSNIKWFCNNAEQLPFKNNYFDFVLCQGVIHHMDKDLKGFKEIFRVVKKGGYSYISVQGKGGLINDFTMKFLRPRYKKDKVFK